MFVTQNEYVLQNRIINGTKLLNYFTIQFLLLLETWYPLGDPIKMDLGSEVRELKLGSSFSNNSNPRNSFHTLKYDFKPASVDMSKVATLDVSSNNQVTVTVPHLDGSGVPKTVFKGNQRNYTKECVLIIDKRTGDITLEKLSHNIQVKKTRSESTTKNIAMPPMVTKMGIENNTQRTQSKTKVSTGVRKNALSGFVPKHSPLQGSPSYPHHKSPQSAPAWNANNGQSTLPSIPMIGLDDDCGSATMSNVASGSSVPLHQTTTTTAPTTSASMNAASNSSDLNLTSHYNTPSVIPASVPISANSVSGLPLTSMTHTANDIGVLSSSDSSSDSESSGSESDSDSTQNSPVKSNANLINHHMGNGSLPTLLLSEDLCLSSESNSDSDDD